MSVARILVFAIALTHVVGLADLVLEDACAELCEDDGCGTDCLPGVACRCHCPGAVPTLGAPAPSAANADSTRVSRPRAADDRIHASPDPREILHVPRPVG